MGEWVRGIDTGTNTVKGGWRDGWSNGEKGERHVIICRSSTSPVNPRSRLTWLIKEAIKGPPPEILRERRESGRMTQAREIERGPNGENERREREEGEEEEREWCELCYCYIWHPILLHSLLRPIQSISLLCFFSACITLWSLSNRHLQSANSSDSPHWGKQPALRQKLVH